ncbi:MAG: hypothetical protein AABZ30_11100 [Myxococcota bacterium]
MRRAFVTLLVLRAALAKGEGGGADVPCEMTDAPRAYAVRFPPDEASPLVVATNFGLLLSRDGGERFELVCPDALELNRQPNGLQPSALTPTVALLPGGVVLATRMPGGLFRSEDGCAWPLVTDAYVWQHRLGAMSVSPAGTVFLAVTFGIDPLGVLRSADGLALTLLVLGAGDLVPGSVASSGDRVYATAGTLAGAEQRLFASDDAGETWELSATFDVTGLGIAAVDGADPLRLLLRQRGRGYCEFTDELVLSDDGGATSRVVFASSVDPITGALLREDGSAWVATLAGGVRVSRDDGETWQSAGGPAAARCLASKGDAVLACLPTPDQGFGLVARTTDDGETWQPWLTWDRIAGPPECLADACAAHWEVIRETWIGAPPAGDGDASASDAGASDVSAPTQAEAKGCGCVLAARRAEAPCSLLGLAALVAYRCFPRRGGFCSRDGRTTRSNARPSRSRAAVKCRTSRVAIRVTPTSSARATIEASTRPIPRSA